MRRMVAAVCLLLLVPTLACAAEKKVHLSELKAQVPDYWEASYTNKKGRTVAFRAPILMPEADTFPIMRVVRNYGTEAFQQKYGYDPNKIGEFVTIGPNFDNIREEFTYEGMWTAGKEQTFYYDLWQKMPQTDTKTVYAPGCDESLADAYDEMNGLVREALGDAYDLLPTKACIRDVIRDKNGETAECGPFTGRGQYFLEGIVRYRGIPLLGGPRFGTGYDNRTAEKAGAGTGTITYNKWTDDVFQFYTEAFEEQEIIVADAKLCDFDTIQAVIEKLIDNDKIQGIYSIQLGYIMWLDPNVKYAQGRKQQDIMEGKRKPQIAMPFWLVDCEYMSMTGIDYQDYPEYQDSPYVADVDVRKTMGHTNVCINAQTGEVVNPHDDSAKRMICPKIVK